MWQLGAPLGLGFWPPNYTPIPPPAFVWRVGCTFEIKAEQRVFEIKSERRVFRVKRWCK